jgi:hypothetical protein
VGGHSEDLRQSIEDNAEEPLIIAAAVPWAGSENELVGSRAKGDVQWWYGDIEVPYQGAVNSAEGSMASGRGVMRT